MEKTMENIILILSKATNKENLHSIDVNTDMRSQGIDSLDSMSFFFSLEKAFNIKISNDEQNQLHNLNDVFNFVKSKS
jgi:acyl carrier protein